MITDNIIYIKAQGRMIRCGHPKMHPESTNFVILWNGLDWSGFRTLAECEKQFPELLKKDGVYMVVER
jgi:hypothetical protein